MTPILLSAIDAAEEMQALLLDTFSEHVFHLQRRSEELQLPGAARGRGSASRWSCPRRWRRATLTRDSWWRTGRATSASRSAVRGGEELATAAGHVIELSEFRERGRADGLPVRAARRAGAARRRTAPPGRDPVRFVGGGGEVRARRRWCRPRSSLELLAQLQVDGQAPTASPPRASPGAPSGGCWRAPRARCGRGVSNWMSSPAWCGWWRTSLKVAPEAVRSSWARTRPRSEPRGEDDPGRAGAGPGDAPGPRSSPSATWRWIALTHKSYVNENRDQTSRTTSGWSSWATPWWTWPSATG